MYVAFIVNKPATSVFPIPVPGPNFQNNFFSHFNFYYHSFFHYQNDDVVRVLIVNIIQQPIPIPLNRFPSLLLTHPLFSAVPSLSLPLFTHPLSISLSIFISYRWEAIGEITILFDHNDPLTRYGA